MDQVGYVTKINGDLAEISVRRSSACGHSCDSCKGGCSVQGITIISKNVVGARVGDYVEIKTQTSAVLKSAFILYIIPLSMMIVGVLAGIKIFQKLGFASYESWGFLLGVIFLGLSYILLKIIDRKAKQKNEISFEITTIYK